MVLRFRYVYINYNKVRARDGEDQENNLMSETIKEKLLRNQSRIDEVRRDVKTALQIIDVLNTPTEQLVEQQGVDMMTLLELDDPQLGHDPKKLTEAQKQEAVNRRKQQIAQSLHELLDAIYADIDSIANDL